MHKENNSRGLSNILYVFIRDVMVKISMGLIMI